MHQYQSELPVTVKSGAILRRPVMRERWELSNDDVVLLEKIGRVSIHLFLNILQTVYLYSIKKW